MEILIIICKIFIFYWQTDRLDMIQIVEVPFLTFLFLLSLFVFFRGRKKVGMPIFYLVYTIITLVMFADAAYSSYFGKYISVNQIYQISSLGTIAKDGNVIGAAVNPLCLLTLIDLPVMIWWCQHGKMQKKESKLKLNWRVLHIGLYIVTICCFIYYGFNINNERYVQKINHIEFFTYHTNDLIVNVGGKLKRKNINEEALLQRMDRVLPKSEGTDYQGIAKGKNLILIQVESLNDFVIGTEYNGQKVTPNIDELLKKDTFYFDRFYSTTGVGNTCDAEFSTLNSLYANDIRECYRMYVDNTFDGLPWMLRREGYSTMAFHGYVKTFWNRNEAYKNQGIGHYYSQEELVTDEVSGFGLTDKHMFHQAVEILKTKQEPFFSFMITLTNHIPYDMPEELATLELASSEQGTSFGRYLQTVHYTDEAIGLLINELKEAGLYENTMIVFYGDHQGMNKETPEVWEKVSEFLGKPYEFEEMLKVPLVIHIPGLGEHKTITTVGGQVDTMPTIANLMGLKINQPYVFGHDLLNTKEGFLAQISYIGKGSYIDGNNSMIFAIGKDGTVEHGEVFHIPDGGIMNLNMELCQQNSERAMEMLDTCMEALDHNLIANYVTH